MGQYIEKQIMNNKMEIFKLAIQAGDGSFEFSNEQMKFLVEVKTKLSNCRWLLNHR